MKTVFQTGPGFYAADTNKVDKSIAPDTLRVYCARLEAYEFPRDSEDAKNIQFKVLFAQADGNPAVAKALLKLGQAIKSNEEILKRFASQ